MYLVWLSIWILFYFRCKIHRHVCLWVRNNMDIFVWISLKSLETLQTSPIIIKISVTPKRKTLRVNNAHTLKLITKRSNWMSNQQIYFWQQGKMKNEDIRRLWKFQNIINNLESHWSSGINKYRTQSCVEVSLTSPAYV